MGAVINIVSVINSTSADLPLITGMRGGQLVYLTDTGQLVSYDAVADAWSYLT